jgi:hypothetical protein
VACSGMMFVFKFNEICDLVQKLLEGEGVQRERHDNIISLSLFIK